VSVRYLGGGRVVDLGPSSAIHARGRVPGGVMVSQAIAPMPRLKGLTLHKGSGGTIVPRLVDTPEQAEARRIRSRETYDAFKARHTGCECHELYGGQPRPKGYLERERDRDRLRRELGKR